MMWQAVGTRCRALLSAVRTNLTAARVGRVALGLCAAAFFAIAAEAAFRARIAPPLSRVPTAIYTRPTPWGDRGDRAASVVIAPTGAGPAEYRIPVPLDALPDRLIQAVLAVEDQRFYGHDGLDFRRIGGAALANVRAKQITQGGSTITQQLVKNLFLSSARTPLRKIREAAIASVLEEQYDKGTILEAYLNEIYLGQDGPKAIHGVGAAARFYFGKDVRKITLAEAALLAGMIRAPNRYAPHRHPRAARDRRDLVLGLMAEQERISGKTAGQARRVAISTRTSPSQTLDARYFRDFVMTAMPQRVPARGAAIYTTLDAGLQRAAERAVTEGLGRLRAGDVQAALVVIDPRTGHVLAMVGGRDYGASQFNRATDAHRQPGSAFKPIVALAALGRQGGSAPAFTLASVIEDAPLRVRSGPDNWEPTNYDRSFRGAVTFRDAIEQSLNVPLVRVGLAVGPERIAATARRLGIESPQRAVPSLALGSSEVTLLELVRAYGVFATGGDLAATRTVIARSALGALTVNDEEPGVRRVADPAEAYLVTSALEGVIARGTGRGLEAGARFPGIAGKTGTSNDWRDAWFVAYAPGLVVGAWVGFDDGRSLRLSGADAALPIVGRFLSQIRRGAGGQFPVPDGVEIAEIDGGHGDWAWGCDTREVFLAGTAPESDCGRRDEPDWYDRRGSDRRGADWRRLEDEAENLIARLVERWRDARPDGGRRNRRDR